MGILGYTMGILGYTRVYMGILGYTRVYNRYTVGIQGSAVARGGPGGPVPPPSFFPKK